MSSAPAFLLLKDRACNILDSFIVYKFHEKKQKCAALTALPSVWLSVPSYFVAPEEVHHSKKGGVPEST